MPHEQQVRIEALKVLASLTHERVEPAGWLRMAEVIEAFILRGRKHAVDRLSAVEQEVEAVRV
ncbi:MAG TPA: hypothetical protein VGG92_09070 [Caulobacteraceae bacterium]|jgi:hypothetical protein